MVQTSGGDNTWVMASNLEFVVLKTGWYTIGVKGGDGDGLADYNLHVYSSVSPVHLYQGQV